MVFNRMGINADILSDSYLFLINIFLQVSCDIVN